MMPSVVWRLSVAGFASSSCGWMAGRSGNDSRYLPLQDDIASVAFWYQREPHAPFPALPDRDVLAVN